MCIRDRAEADLVLGVPDSGIPSAMGFAFESGIPYSDGIVKNLSLIHIWRRPAHI